ncbi:DNA-binding response regulator [Clostridium sporogenes]|uniref:Stage 0 sporulation protein A homolog n=1 Tax=Clostridium sporogenes TaxID=1509 RepID=A0A7U4JNH5_CLOSG|nr:transcriptional regulatory protein WalR [Clostridium sporogenes]EHN15975.1 two component transcriptional regulator, winged helix family protein [Clostridium sporogenes PA 3679]STC77855.1 two component transcriptional regulator [Clostridium botulinum]KCZ69714.1 transcriptional regulatory protein WalR [Clostridium sporogenes]KYN78548.1 DNA-binding response regulator [Clostridium sporogenes]
MMKGVTLVGKRILIIEDEKKLNDIMALYLKKEGYEVYSAYDGKEGEELIENEDFNLIILDVMMPQKDGWTLLRKINKKGSTPVIMTTARGEEEDRIFGLELGAVDYMVKPISMKELILRVGLRIKSYEKEEKEEDILTFENMVVYPSKRIVKEGNNEIALTPKEFDLLTFLCRNPEQVFKREHLLDKVWSYDFMGDTRTVDTHIKNLREKIQYCNEHLKTVWGVGYKLQTK